MFLCVEKVQKELFLPLIYLLYHDSSFCLLSALTAKLSDISCIFRSSLKKKKKISAIQSYIVRSSVLIQVTEMLHRIFLDHGQLSSSSF